MQNWPLKEAASLLCQRKPYRKKKGYEQIVHTPFRFMIGQNLLCRRHPIGCFFALQDGDALLFLSYTVELTLPENCGIMNS